MRAPRLVPLLLLLSFLPVAGRAAAEPASLPAGPTAQWINALFESWKAPVPPRHVGGNLYYVGTNGVSAWLITTPAGHILIDSGFADTVPLVRRSIEKLGFKVSDIKLLLGSHAHIDHTGGHAAMQRLTGARVVASAADARVLESGGADDFLPWPAETLRYEPVKVDRIVADREEVSLGGTTLVANLTPGHTRGATTWTMRLSDHGRTYDVVFFSSASVNDGVRLLHNERFPEIAAAFASSFARWKELPCDIHLAPHGGQFAMAEKFARLDRGEGIAAFVDREGWRQLIAGAEQAYRDLLARERAREQLP